MIEPEPRFSDHEIEGLVRRHLDRESEQIDPRPLFAKIQRDLLGASAPRSSRRRHPVARWFAIASMAAAVLLIAVVAVSWRGRTALAKGETVVREARQAHQVPIDRCYLVEVRRESSVAVELAPNLPQVKVTRLWTRGDRFWVESARPDQRWSWGRDVNNRFWIAFGPHNAIRMEPDEVPDWLNLYCDLHSLNVEQLLGEVLNRFDLTREVNLPDSDSSTIRVTARARPLAIPPLRPSIETAEIEIDAETRVIRRLTIRRVWNGEPFATLTCNLLETDVLDPAKYQVEGHLTEPSEIFNRDHEPHRRKELLSRWFGNRPGRWLPQSLDRPQ